MLAGSGIAGLLCAAVAWLVRAGTQTGVGGAAIFPSFLLLPMLSGLTAAFCWRKLELKLGETAALCALLTLLDLIGAAVVLREGIVCLVLVSPLLYGLVLAGGALGRVLFRTDPSNLRVSVLPLLAVLALAEPFTRADQTGIVTDEIVIYAPPALV